jgi:hypothetical protein
MTDFDLSLSSAALKNTVIGNIDENFVFIVSSEEYNCPRVISEFLSPRLCLSPSVDSLIDESIVKNPYSNHEFHLFLSFGTGSTIHLQGVNEIEEWNGRANETRAGSF